MVSQVPLKQRGGHIWGVGMVSRVVGGTPEGASSGVTQCCVERSPQNWAMAWLIVF